MAARIRGDCVAVTARSNGGDAPLAGEALGTSPSWMPEDPLSLKGGKEHGSSLHLLKEFDQSMTERDVGGTGEGVPGDSGKNGRCLRTDGRNGGDVAAHDWLYLHRHCGW
ncbi:uncharacterized protein An11g03020 [Aspergillus niger]|uniref:Contig An11c0110, genomic contig n=2 Tax=Aspergillus niger TaxID=5061 RepID=A2QVY0_ASPNC|nr:uncharacterized protein An11g03020 [Aspergillus niger]CAK40634.1 unnamed protein product [Aspergillus niger]